MKRTLLNPVSLGLAAAVSLFTLAVNAMAGSERHSRLTREQKVELKAKFRAACESDVAKLCPDAADGERPFLKIACLRGQVSRVSESCKTVIESMPKRGRR